jgi:hypothetical protein
LSEKADPGIPGYAVRALGVGHVIAPPDKRKRGDLSFKIELYRVREMFNGLPHGNFGKSDEVNIAKGLRVLVPRPDIGIGVHTDLDPAVKTEQ